MRRGQRRQGRRGPLHRVSTPAGKLQRRPKEGRRAGRAAGAHVRRRLARAVPRAARRRGARRIVGGRGRCSRCTLLPRREPGAAARRGPAGRWWTRRWTRAAGGSARRRRHCRGRGRNRLRRPQKRTVEEPLDDDERVADFAQGRPKAAKRRASPGECRDVFGGPIGSVGVGVRSRRRRRRREQREGAAVAVGHPAAVLRCVLPRGRRHRRSARAKWLRK